MAHRPFSYLVSGVESDPVYRGPHSFARKGGRNPTLSLATGQLQTKQEQKIRLWKKIDAYNPMRYLVVVTIHQAAQATDE